MSNEIRKVEASQEPQGSTNPWYWAGGIMHEQDYRQPGWYWSDEAEQLGDGIAYPTREAAEQELIKYAQWLNGNDSGQE